jgi:hypothetical protein
VADAFTVLPQSSSKRQSSPSGPAAFEKPKDQKRECNTGQGAGKPLSAAELDILREMQEEFGEDLEGLDAAPADPFEFVDAAATADSSLPALEGVPDDLVPLAVAGLTLGAIRKLMGLASRAGTRLGDVVAVAGRHILKARRAYSYVLKLLRSGKDWAALARNPGEGKLARKEAGTAWRLTPQEAIQLGSAAHKLLGDGMCAVSACGAVWSVRDGVICEATLSQVERSNWGAPAAHRGTAEGYASLARRIVTRYESGELQLMSSADVVCYAAEEAVISARLRASAGPGLAVVDRVQGLAWRYGLQGLEQAELRALTNRKGVRYLPWAQQRQPGFELRLARLWRDGQATVVEESDLLDLAAARNATSRTTQAARPSSPASGLISTFLPSLQIA